MRKPSVTILDYGVGNLLSVVRAFEYCGADVEVTDDSDRILQSERLVLPGVGAFADGMKGLKERKLDTAIKQFVELNKPFLGICLGMQMMMDSSEEFGYNEGLSIIPGKVVKIPELKSDGTPHKIPHIGWNDLKLSKERTLWGNTLLDGVKEGSSVYFVHSFTAKPKFIEHRLADAYYNGQLISAVIQKGKSYGCQFHPEKSAQVGLQIIKNFIAMK